MFPSFNTVYEQILDGQWRPGPGLEVLHENGQIVPIQVKLVTDTSPSMIAACTSTVTANNRSPVCLNPSVSWTTLRQFLLCSSVVYFEMVCVHHIADQGGGCSYAGLRSVHMHMQDAEL